MSSLEFPKTFQNNLKDTVFSTLLNVYDEALFCENKKSSVSLRMHEISKYETAHWSFPVT